MMQSPCEAKLHLRITEYSALPSDKSTHLLSGSHNYFSLIAYVNNSPEWGRMLLGKTFDPVVREFIAAIRESLPEAAPEDIFWGYNFLTGAMTLSFAETGRLDALSDGLCRSDDVGAMKSRLGPYVAAGLRGLAGRPQTPLPAKADAPAAKARRVPSKKR
jgi:Tetracyclin repressor-like, C-terminal domain